ADFTKKAVSAERRTDISPKDLDRYLTSVLEIARQIDNRCAPAPDAALDLVPIRQRDGKAGTKLLHGGEPPYVVACSPVSALSRLLASSTLGRSSTSASFQSRTNLA